MSSNPEPTTVNISATALEGIVARAEARVEGLRRAGRLTPTASPANLLKSNVRGVAGEQAVLRWLQKVLREPSMASDISDSAASLSDLEISLPSATAGIEVKTTTYSRWRTYGRSVDVDQLDRTDAAIYVWCLAPDTPRPTEIRIAGWSPTSEVREHTAEQSYIRREPRWKLPAPQSAASGPRSSGPDYDVGDPGFDDFEWSQSRGDDRGVAPERPDRYWDPPAPAAAASATPQRSTARHQWEEGDEPRPIVAARTRRVRVTATVRPLDELLGWLRQWDQEGP